MVGIVVERWIPAVTVNLSDAVATIFHIVPEGWYVGGIGQNCSCPHNGDGARGCVFHGDTPITVDRKNLRHRLHALGLAAVQYVCDVIQIRNEARLHAVNGGQSQTRFKPADLGSTDTSGS